MENPEKNFFKNKLFIILATTLVLLLFISFYAYFHIKKTNSVQNFQDSKNASEVLSPSTTISYTFKTFKNEGFEATLPVITLYKNTTTINEINKDIQKQVWGCYDGYTKEDLADALKFRNTGYSDKEISLMSEDRIKKELGWQMSVATSSDIYAENDLFSFALSSSGYYCGGMYTGDFVDGYTYDLVSGKLLTLQDIFSNLNDVKTKNKIIAIFDKRYREYQENEEQGECRDQFSSLDFDTEKFYLAEDTFIITPSFPHALAACYVDIDVPISEIQQYVKSDSPLKRMLK